LTISKYIFASFAFADFFVLVEKKSIFFAEPITYLSHSGVCHEAREQVKKVLL
jgi:hypothetical protein